MQAIEPYYLSSKKHCNINTYQVVSMKGLLFFLLVFAFVGNTFASEVGRYEQGWFWGERYQEEKTEASTDEEPLLEDLLSEKQSEEKDCTNPLEWDVSCGFVHPKRDYDFSQVQFKELTKQLAMYPEDVSRVLQYQKFVHWAVDQAVTAAKSAEWNIIQNQDMNPFIENPIGSFGMRAAARALTDHNKTVVQDIAEQGGFLVMFTRNDCVYCHKMYPTNWLMAKELGLDLYNAPLDGVCLEGFDKDFCYAGDDVEFAAQYLDVFMVPDLFLYLPKDDVWIRVSSGVEAQETIKRRVVTFFGAAKNAAQKGLKNAASENRPAVNFESKDIFERAKEGVGVAAGVVKQSEAKNADK